MITSLASAVFVVGAWIARVRTGTWLNPFTPPLFVFALEAALAGGVGVVQPSENYAALSLRTQLIVLVVSLSSLALVGFLGESRLAGPVQIRPRMPLRLLILFAGVLIVGATVYLIGRNEGVPFLTIARKFAMGWGTHYSEYDIPFLTPAAQGLNRFIFLLLAIDLMAMGVPLREHLRRRSVEYTVALVTLICVFASGRRNVFLWPVLFLSIANVMRGWRPRSLFRPKTIAAMAIILLAFTWAGNVRLGGSGVSASPLSHLVAEELGESWLSGVLTGAVLYLAPNLSNLDVMVENGPRPAGGLIIVSQMLPRGVVELFGEEPASAITYLRERELLPFRGMTFRTIFADLAADFGPYGAVLAGMLLFGLSVVAHNRARRSGHWLKLYLAFIPGLIMFPLLNQYTGLPTLLPVLLLGTLVRVRADVPGGGAVRGVRGRTAGYQSTKSSIPA